MKPDAPGVIERAYQLAQNATNVDEIRSQLRKEGYSNVDAHLAGPKIRSDLVKIIKRPGGPTDMESLPTGDDLEEVEIAVTCPKCGNNALKSIGSLDDQRQLACGSCDESFSLDDNGFRDAVLDARKSIARARKEVADPAG